MSTTTTTVTDGTATVECDPGDAQATAAKLLKAAGGNAAQVRTVMAGAGIAFSVPEELARKAGLIQAPRRETAAQRRAREQAADSGTETEPATDA